jgi:hypothetical protein
VSGTAVSNGDGHEVSVLCTMHYVAVSNGDGHEVSGTAELGSVGNAGRTNESPSA